MGAVKNHLMELEERKQALQLSYCCKAPIIKTVIGVLGSFERTEFTCSVCSMFPESDPEAINKAVARQKEVEATQVARNEEKQALVRITEYVQNKIVPLDITCVGKGVDEIVIDILSEYVKNHVK